MSAHTPGPWSQYAASVSAAKGLPIADAKGAFGQPAEANARLIAAAPDLAAACKAAMSLAWEVGTETEDGVHTLLEDSRGDLWRQLSAALAKAGGA